MTAAEIQRYGAPALPVPERSARPVAIDDRPAGLRRRAVIVAALLHVAALAWLWLDRPLFPAVEPPRAIPVTLRIEPTPPPAPEPARKPKAVPKFRESGADDTTAAPPPAERAGPETAPRPDAGQAAATAAPSTPPPPPAPSATASPLPVPPPAARDAAPHATRAMPLRRPEAPAATAPRPAPPRRVDVAAGPRVKRGDPYLNHLRDLIERQRRYPASARTLGLAGQPRYNLLIDRSGRLRGVTLAFSSGASLLDETGAAMIRSAAPFPPLPADWPDAVLIDVAIPLAPE